MAVIESADVDEMAQWLNDSYARFRLTTSGADPRMRIDRTALTRHVAVERLSFSVRFDGDAAALGFVPVVRVRSGFASHRMGRDGTDNRAGDLFVACRPDVDWCFTLIDLVADTVQIDPLLLAGIADTVPRRSPQPPRFTGFRPLSAVAARHWNVTLDYVLDAVTVGATLTDHPLIGDSLARLLATAALTVFPNNVAHDPTAAERRDAHPQAVRRALSFIDDNAHRVISVADVATAARVGIRAVRLAFRRHLDTTPEEYLRGVRLHGVHRDLQAGDLAGESVQQIAARWGFVHPGRFAAAYRATFGRSPWNTLHPR